MTTDPNPSRIPVITLWQPWASMIASGHKTIETRKHSKFSGLKGQTIGIHAGKKFDAAAMPTLAPLLRKLGMPIMKKHYPEGQILCTAHVTDCGWLTMFESGEACIWAAGRFGLYLSNINWLIHRVYAKGKQGIWYVDWGELK